MVLLCVLDPDELGSPSPCGAALNPAILIPNGSSNHQEVSTLRVGIRYQSRNNVVNIIHDFREVAPSTKGDNKDINPVKAVNYFFLL